VDMSSSSYEAHIQEVEKILLELGLDHLPRLLVFTKEDRLGREEGEAICRKYGAISLSAHHPESLMKLLLAIERKLWQENAPVALPVDKRSIFEVPNSHFLT